MPGNADSIDNKGSKWRKRKGRWKKLRRGYPIFPFHVTIFPLWTFKNRNPLSYIPFVLKTKTTLSLFPFLSSSIINLFFITHPQRPHLFHLVHPPSQCQHTPFRCHTFHLIYDWPLCRIQRLTKQITQKKPPPICNNITLPFFINLKLFHLKISQLHSRPQTTNHQIYHEAPSIVSLFLPFLTQPQPLM